MVSRELAGSYRMCCAVPVRTAPAMDRDPGNVDEPVRLATLVVLHDPDRADVMEHGHELGQPQP